MQNAGYIIVSKLFLIAIIPETIFAYLIFYDLREITKIYLDHREINRYGISIQLSCISWLFFYRTCNISYRTFTMASLWVRYLFYFFPFCASCSHWGGARIKWYVCSRSMYAIECVFYLFSNCIFYYEMNEPSLYSFLN